MFILLKCSLSNHFLNRLTGGQLKNMNILSSPRLNGLNMYCWVSAGGEERRGRCGGKHRRSMEKEAKANSRRCFMGEWLLLDCVADKLKKGGQGQQWGFIFVHILLFYYMYTLGNLCSFISLLQDTTQHCFMVLKSSLL